jgi:hypothetical protein
MRSKHFLALAAVGFGFGAIALAGTGCGGGTSTNVGGGGSTTTVTTTTTTTKTTTTTTGTGGAGIHSFDTAGDLPIDTTGLEADLVDADTSDYYKFTGAKGDHMVFYGTAWGLTGSTGENDGTAVDVVVSIYDANKKLIASDDDAWPRDSTDAVLYTELPADGDYYVKIQDCNAYAGENPTSGIGCAPVSGINNFHYQLIGFPMDTTKFPWGKATGATAVSYTAGSTAGTFSATPFGGDFAAKGEKHAFTLNPPAALTVDATHHPRALFWVQPTGTMDGNGSTTDIHIYATSDAAGTQVIASADQTNYTNGDDPNNGPLEFSFPLPLTAGAVSTAPIYVWAENLGAGAGFYYAWHAIGEEYLTRAEAETAGQNDTMATAEALVSVGTSGGAFSVEGTLSSATDVDWYSFTIPTTVTGSSGAAAPDHIELDCNVARQGSGIVGLTATLMDSTGKATTVLVSDTNAKKDATVGGDGKLVIPTGLVGKAAFLKISATGQDAKNAGNYYQCAAYFFTATP